jgi:drug/metabolite transporter (DMT)-like permease
VYDVILLLVAFFWGSTFILVKRAVEVIDVYSFLGIRFTLAAVLLGAGLGKRWRGLDRRTVLAGTALGAALFLSYAFQTVGLTLTAASNAGFVTGLSVVMVPIFSSVVFRAFPPLQAAVGVVLACAGLMLLTGSGSGGSFRGDALVFVCAVFVALHILLTGRFAKTCDPYLLAGVQLAAVAVFGLVSMAVLPGRRLSFAPVVLWAWLITVLFATIFAFVVQTAAQRVVSPTSTALIFSMEPVFAALFARLLGAEVLSLSGYVGGALIFSGMLITELTPSEWNVFRRTLTKNKGLRGPKEEQP